MAMLPEDFNAEKMPGITHLLMGRVDRETTEIARAFRMHVSSRLRPNEVTSSFRL